MREFYSMAGYATGSRYRPATLASMPDDVARRHPTREALGFVPDVPRTPGPHGDKVQRARLREDTLRLLGGER